MCGWHSMISAPAIPRWRTCTASPSTFSRSPHLRRTAGTRGWRHGQRRGRRGTGPRHLSLADALWVSTRWRRASRRVPARHLAGARVQDRAGLFVRQGDASRRGARRRRHAATRGARRQRAGARRVLGDGTIPRSGGKRLTRFLCGDIPHDITLGMVLIIPSAESGLPNGRKAEKCVGFRPVDVVYSSPAPKTSKTE